jgi:hypothetical protein
MRGTCWRALPRPDWSPSADAPATGRKTPPLPILVRLTTVAALAPLLTRAGLHRLQRWLEPRHPLPAPEPADAERIMAQLAWWVDAVIRRGHPVVRPGCLTRGVTLYYALRRCGVAVDLCFGVGPDQGAMAGHCWLDLDGRPVLERVDPLSKFTEVVRVTSSGLVNRGN